MNEKLAKKLRKETRRYMKGQWRSDLDFLQALPFGTRLRIAFQIMFPLGKKQKDKTLSSKVQRDRQFIAEHGGW
jgi:hypothetical protein